MTRTHLLAATGACIAITLSVPAQAGTYAAGCTTEPQASWKAVDTSAAKAVELGYKVAKSKVSGTCHEVYATRDGKRFELFFNPVSNTLVHTETKG